MSICIWLFKGSNYLGNRFVITKPSKQLLLLDIHFFVGTKNKIKKCIIKKKIM